MAKKLKFFATVFLIWGLSHYYFYSRISSGLLLNEHGRTVLGLALIALALLYPAGTLLSNWVGPNYCSLCIVPGAVWLGVAALLFSSLAIFDIVVSLPTLIAKAFGLIDGKVFKTIQHYGIVAMLAFTSFATVVSLYNGLKTPEVKSIEVKIAGLAPEIDNFRIINLSDIHIGSMISKRQVAEIVEISNSMEPDAVVLSGDIVDEPYERIAEKMKLLLCGLKAKQGVFATRGNHEYYAGSAGIEEGMKSCWVKILKQEHVVIKDSLVLAGVDDPAFLAGSEHISEAIEKSLSGRPSSLPVILVSHQPIGIEKAAQSGVSLMLTGHTHGGQIPPMHLHPLIAYRYLSGSYRINGMELYVNNGAAYWGPPMRLFAPKEILLVVLRRLPRPDR